MDDVAAAGEIRELERVRACGQRDSWQLDRSAEGESQRVPDSGILLPLMLSAASALS